MIACRPFGLLLNPIDFWVVTPGIYYGVPRFCARAVEEVSGFSPAFCAAAFCSVFCFLLCKRLSTLHFGDWLFRNYWPVFAGKKKKKEQAALQCLTYYIVMVKIYIEYW